MTDLLRDARRFATEAHHRIDHRRRYTNRPYATHLRAVAEIVRSVTDDPELLAAARLHDILEDTTATAEEIERKFGAGVAALVVDLTDVSRPSDGNRAQRKAIDRQHLARASDRAKTIKLADVIDNCTDVVRNDPRFGRVFVAEARSLLDVLEGGHPALLGRARAVVQRSAEKLGLGELAKESELDPPLPSGVVIEQGALRRFGQYFRATDVAEPLRSFDAGREACEVAAALRAPIVGVRVDGEVRGYRRRDEVSGSDAMPHHPITAGQLLDASSPLAEVILGLARHDFCFVTLLGQVVGYVSRQEMQKPVVRMWLFGLVTLIELEITAQLRERWRDDSWTALVSKGRLARARELQRERERRGGEIPLLDCLQLGDKGGLLAREPEVVAALGFPTRGAAKKVVRELESLRNHLAHAQDIVSQDWTHIVRLARRLEAFAR